LGVGIGERLILVGCQGDVEEGWVLGSVPFSGQVDREGYIVICESALYLIKLLQMGSRRNGLTWSDVLGAGRNSHLELGFVTSVL
jgi:hypothetical protein